MSVTYHRSVTKRNLRLDLTTFEGLLTMVAEIVSPPTLVPTLVKPSSRAIDLSVRCQVFHRFSPGGFHLVIIVQTATKCRRDSADLLNWMLLFCLGMKCKAGVENYSRIIFTVLYFYRIADWFVDTFVSLFSFHLFFSFLVIPSIRNIRIRSWKMSIVQYSWKDPPIKRIWDVIFFH